LLIAATYIPLFPPLHAFAFLAAAAATGAACCYS
jgi:hypothetical protein